MEAALGRRAQAGCERSVNGSATLNDALVRLEQRLLDESEPPAKRWYRHVIYGWNIYSLYEGQPLPGLAEAIRVGDAAAVTRETTRLEQALGRLVTGLQEIARLADALVDAESCSASSATSYTRRHRRLNPDARDASNWQLSTGSCVGGSL